MTAVQHLRLTHPALDFWIDVRLRELAVATGPGRTRPGVARGRGASGGRSTPGHRTDAILAGALGDDNTPRLVPTERLVGAPAMAVSEPGPARAGWRA